MGHNQDSLEICTIWSLSYDMFYELWKSIAIEHPIIQTLSVGTFHSFSHVVNIEKEVNAMYYGEHGFEYKESYGELNFEMILSIVSADQSLLVTIKNTDIKNVSHMLIDVHKFGD